MLSNDSLVLKVSFDVNEDLEDELDKPGTATGTKFSVLQIIRIPISMRCGFRPLILFVKISVFNEKFS